MRKERTLTIFLEDGTKEGVKKLSIGTYTGEMLFAPRDDFEKVKVGWKEIVTKRGVYFLFGEDDDGFPKVYVGKADCVSSRISSHVKEKDFWNDFAVFTESKLGPTEISYLESALINRATNANSYSVENKNQPSAFDDIRKEVKAECERHIENIQLMLEMADRDILSDDVVLLKKDDKQITPNITEREIEVFFRNGFGTACGVYDHKSGKLRVLAGSPISPIEHSSWQSKSGRKMRKEYIKSGEIIKENNCFSLKDELLFNSPSAAAAFVYAGESNGRKNWKTADGKSINDLFYNK